ncbi:hypothetical protein TR2A62_1880 [Thalassobium sp. R2A62]|nr:hypothetical protein TR2A62_1880 [Thalassobium sp. R2A62]
MIIEIPNSARKKAPIITLDWIVFGTGVVAVIAAAFALMNATPITLVIN